MATDIWAKVTFLENNLGILFTAKEGVTGEQQMAWLEKTYPEKHWRWRTQYCDGDIRRPVVFLWKDACAWKFVPDEEEMEDDIAKTEERVPLEFGGESLLQGKKTNRIYRRTDAGDLIWVGFPGLGRFKDVPRI